MSYGINKFLYIFNTYFMNFWNLWTADTNTRELGASLQVFPDSVNHELDGGFIMNNPRALLQLYYGERVSMNPDRWIHLEGRD
jgi:hypothetical protein